MAILSDVTLPDIRIEAGLVPDNPVQVSTSLILDDATYGLLDTGTLGTSTIYTNISEWVRSFSINRSSNRNQGPLLQFQSGSLSVVLDNSDGRFDPDNLNGPYVTGGVSQLDVMVPIRVSVAFGGVIYYLFDGYIDSWNPSTLSGYTQYAEMSITASDAFKIFSNIDIPEDSAAGSGEDTGARITRILQSIDWYTDGEKNSIDTGNSTLQGTTWGDNALSLMQIAADSEIGQVYIGGQGQVVFNSRHALLTNSASNTVQAVFGDSPGTAQTAGTEISYAAVNRALDDTTMANNVQATRVGGALQQVSDTSSISNYLFKRSYERSDLILQTDTDALEWAQWVLYIARDAENRFDSIVVDPLADSDNLWPQVLGREFADRIQIWHRPPQVDDPITKDCFITGVQHTCDIVAGTWNTTWSLQSADKYGSLVRSAIRGSGNVILLLLVRFAYC